MASTVRPEVPTRATGKASKQALKLLWRKSPPSRFLDYRDFLKALQVAVAEMVGRYGYQQFSEDLGFGGTNVAYLVTHGYRRLGEEQARTIVDTLSMTHAERRYFLALVDYSDCREDEERRRRFRQLVAIKEEIVETEDDRSSLKFFNEWQHAAIFELIGTEGCRADPDWIAERFYRRLTKEQVKRSLELMTQMGLISLDETAGRYVKSKASVSTGDDVKGLAIAGYHLQMLAAAQAALSQVPGDEREFGALTLAVDESILKRLKEDVRLFRRYASFLSEQCSAPDRVVQVNLQLFSVTRAGED